MKRTRERVFIGPLSWSGVHLSSVIWSNGRHTTFLCPYITAPGGYNIVFLSDLIHIRRASDGERRETIQLLMGPNVKVIRCGGEGGSADKQESSLYSKRLQSELFALGTLAKIF